MSCAVNSALQRSGSCWLLCAYREEFQITRVAANNVLLICLKQIFQREGALLGRHFGAGCAAMSKKGSRALPET